MEFIILKDEHTTEIYSENEEFLGFVRACFHGNYITAWHVYSALPRTEDVLDTREQAEARLVRSAKQALGRRRNVKRSK